MRRRLGKTPNTVLAINTRTGGIASFQSVKDASRRLALNQNTIYMAISRGSLVGGVYCFDYLMKAEHREDFFNAESDADRRIAELEEKVDLLEKELARMAGRYE